MEMVMLSMVTLRKRRNICLVCLFQLKIVWLQCFHHKLLECSILPPFFESQWSTMGNSIPVPHRTRHSYKSSLSNGISRDLNIVVIIILPAWLNFILKKDIQECMGARRTPRYNGILHQIYLHTFVWLCLYQMQKAITKLWIKTLSLLLADFVNWIDPTQDRCSSD